MVREAIENTLASKQLTRDLASQFEGVSSLSTEEFGEALMDKISGARSQN